MTKPIGVNSHSRESNPNKCFMKRCQNKPFKRARYFGRWVMLCRKHSKALDGIGENSDE